MFFLNSVNRLAFAAEKFCVSCEVRTESHILYYLEEIQFIKELSNLKECFYRKVISLNIKNLRYFWILVTV
jgi:hypothetical protein